MAIKPQIEDLLVNPRELRSFQDIDETLLENELEQVFQESKQFQTEATISNSTPSQQQYTVKLPVAPAPSDGSEKEEAQNDFIMIQSLDGLINQNIKNVLFTIKGEKVDDISFGVGLQTFLFSSNSDDTVLKIKKEINSQFSRNLPYLNLINLDVVKSTLNENRIDISLKYSAGNITGVANFTARS